MVQFIRDSNRRFLFSVEGIKLANATPEGLKPIYDSLGTGDKVILRDVDIEIDVRTGNELKEWIEQNCIL